MFVQPPGSIVKKAIVDRDLAQLKIDQLISLKGQIEGLIRQRIEEEKRALRQKLQLIERFESKINSGPALSHFGAEITARESNS
jgi:hypothetical protein